MVFGMNGATVAAGLVDVTVAAENLAACLCKVVTG